MKKIISLLILASVLMGCIVFPSYAAKGYIPGDANGDGAVDMKDSLAIRLYCAGLDDGINVDAADINVDGKVNAADLRLMKRHLAGVEDFTEIYSPFTIADNDLGMYTIVVTNPENANMVFAAEELQKYTKMATARELSVAMDESDSQYQIILREDTEGKLGNDGFNLSVHEGQLVITAGALRGTMYAVYEILEEYMGFRFFGYEDVRVPQGQAVKLPEGLDETQIPDSLYRNNSITPFHNQYTYSAVIKRKLSGSTTASSLNDAKYGYGISRLKANAHSFDVFIPSVIAYNGLQTYCLTSYDSEYEGYEDPETGEWITILDPETGKPTFAIDPDTGEYLYLSIFDECLMNMCELIDERRSWGQQFGKEITEISCSYSPFIKYCTCINCRMVYREEGSYSGTLVDFVNRIDDALDERYDDEITVITNAYGGTRVPPKNRSLNDDVILLYCWNGCVNHTIESCACVPSGVVSTEKDYNGNPVVLGSNTTEQSYYLGWIDHCAQTYIWYYPTNIYYNLAPLCNTFNIYHDMKWFMEHKAVGFYVVGTANDAFDGLNAFLISEMMWDKDITEEEYDALIAEYLEYYYGPGWQNIYDYLKMLEAAGDDMGCYMTEYSHPMQMYSREYFAEHHEEMKALFDEAFVAAETSWQVDNVFKASAHMRFLGLEARYQAEYVNGTEEQKVAYESEYRELYTIINNEDIKISYQQTGINAEFDVTKSPCELIYGFTD